MKSAKETKCQSKIAKTYFEPLNTIQFEIVVANLDENLIVICFSG
jgi:hypothetical protein